MPKGRGSLSRVGRVRSSQVAQTASLAGGDCAPIVAIGYGVGPLIWSCYEAPMTGEST